MSRYIVLDNNINCIYKYAIAIIGTMKEMFINHKWRQKVFPCLARIAHLLSKMGLSKIPFVRNMWSRLHSEAIPDYPVMFELNGVKLLANPAIHGVGLVLLTEGTYEPFTTALFKKLLPKEGMTVVILGANIGYFTMIAARQIGHRGKVIAFEPEPSSYELMVKNAQLNGFDNILTISKAVSDHTGVTRLFIPPHLTKPGESRSVSRIIGGEEGYDSISVETTDLDSFFRNRECSIDVIKMDIEGAEVLALQGMNDVLKNNPHIKIITEFNPKALKRAGSLPQQYLNSLLGLGFKLYRINEEHNNLEPIIDTEVEVNMLENGKKVHCENILAER
jgi:FkbM family methyltransferase